MGMPSDERLRSGSGRHHHDVSGWLARSALCAALKEAITQQRRMILKRGLKRGEERDELSSALALPVCSCAMPRTAGSLRCVFAEILGKAKTVNVKRFSSGATRLVPRRYGCCTNAKD